MKTFPIFVAILASVTFVAEARAQTQVPPPAGQSSPPLDDQTPARGAEKTVEGQVGSVDPSRTELTLTDGTKLVTPPGVVIRPGALTEGMIVVASYRELNGEKVMTGIAVKGKEPSGSPKQN
jgi:Protein of unknown function (DUF1344)